MKKYIIKIIIITFLAQGCQKTEKYFYPTGEILSTVEVDSKGRNHGNLKKFYITGKLEGIGSYSHGEKNGPFKEFYESGELRSIEIFKSNSWLDTTKFYFENGKVSILKFKNEVGDTIQKKYNLNSSVISEGKIISDTLKSGWWKYFNDEEELKFLVEYLKKNGRQHLNQKYAYNKNGTINKDSSNYLVLTFPDTISSNKLTYGEVKLQPYLSKEIGFFMVFYEVSYPSIENKVHKLDSTYGKNDLSAKIWVNAPNKGKIQLKGYVFEKNYSIKENNNDSLLMDIITSEHKMFFEKEIYVKENGNVVN